jgi:hypothetical protein
MCTPISFTGSALYIHGRMKTRIVYSREFLLSLGELEHCKKLPPDFDAALLRSFLPCFLLLRPFAQWPMGFLLLRPCLLLLRPFSSPTVSCRSCQRVCLRETRATTTHPRDGQMGRWDILTLLVVGTLEGGGILAHLDQVIGMGNLIVSLRHRVKLLFCLCNVLH